MNYVMTKAGAKEPRYGSDAERRKEKVIGIDAATFEEVKGKEVKIKISSKALQAMVEDLGENDEWLLFFK